MPETTPNYTLEDIAFLKGDAQRVARESDNRGRAFLALSGAMVWSGLGHLLAGKARWGAFWFATWTTLVIAAVFTLFEPRFLGVLIVVLPLGVVVQFCQLGHAARCAERSDAPMFGDVSSRFLLGGVLAFAGLGECYGTVTYLQDNCIEICYSPTDSMGPNISPGDLFLDFKRESYARWDIVGVDTPTGSDPNIHNLCKRIVGMPGDTVEITGPALLINGKAAALPGGVGPYVPVDTWNTPMLDAEPLAAANGCWGRPITLGPDEYFLLGDNSAISDDGRFWPATGDHQAGATPGDQLRGRIVAIIWPPNRWRVFEPGGK